MHGFLPLNLSVHPRARPRLLSFSTDVVNPASKSLSRRPATKQSSTWSGEAAAFSGLTMRTCTLPCLAVQAPEIQTELGRLDCNETARDQNAFVSRNLTFYGSGVKKLRRPRPALSDACCSAHASENTEATYCPPGRSHSFSSRNNPDEDARRQ